MNVIEDVALELLLIDPEIKIVNEGLSHEIGCDQVLIHIARVRRREPKTPCRCSAAHGYITDM